MTEVQRLFLLLALVAAYFLLRVLGPVLTPFLLAAILAYTCNPLVNRLVRWRLRRSLAVAIVMIGGVVLLLGFVLVLVPILYRQAELFAARTPDYLAWIDGTALPWLQERLAAWTGSSDWTALLRDRINQNMGQLAGFLQAVLGKLTRGGAAVVTFLANLVVMFAVFGYLLADWDNLVARLAALVPRRHDATVRRLAARCDEALGAFLRGQLLIMLYVGVTFSVALLLLGLDLALPIGLLSGAITFIPWVGSAVSAVLTALAALFQFQDLLHPLLGVGLFYAVQIVGDNLITPRIMQNRIGVHPAAIILAILAGGKLFGLFGLVLAVPAAAVTKVVGGYLVERYRESGLYKGSGPAGAPRSRPSPRSQPSRRWRSRRGGD